MKKQMQNNDRESSAVKIEIEDETIVAGIARAAENLLSADTLIERVADAIALRFELLEPQAAAALLDITPRTLADNHVAWGLDKSVAFGASNPRYFLSQILERARAKVLKGARPARLKLEGNQAA
jgi:hypothetical protein